MAKIKLKNNKPSSAVVSLTKKKLGRSTKYRYPSRLSAIVEGNVREALELAIAKQINRSRDMTAVLEDAIGDYIKKHNLPVEDIEKYAERMRKEVVASA